MNSRPLLLLALGSLVSQGAPVAGRAQEPSPSPTPASSPAITVASAERSTWVPLAASASPLATRSIGLALRRVTVRDALRAISAQAGVPVLYDDEDLPTEHVVSLHVDHMTVASALATALQGTGLDAYVSISGTGILIRRPVLPSRVAPHRVQQGGGTLGGRVTDAVTHAPLDQVAVRIEGPGLGAVTTRDGRYTIRSVPLGTFRVTARRVGYTPLMRTITVAPDSATTTDFALIAAPTRLNEMVTTAVGDQRRYEVGSVISTINADSIAPTAPITSLTDLISARAPGVEVLETSGMTGAGEAIRIRGLSSLVLQNDPILIVDGVRQDNTPGGDVGADFSSGYGGSNGGHPTPTRVNDIDFNDIESIDILKGPSASTEYGTDAANGVIVIRTKHGTAGRPQWRISAEQTGSKIPVRFPDGYYSWGHLTDGTRTPVDCPLVPIFAGPASTAGTCAVDSVTRWNPLNHAATSIFGTGSRGKYDLSVSGGSEAVRYFVSGGLSNERGIIRMPPAFLRLADTAALGLPSSALSPNTEQQRSVRVNTAMRLGPTMDLTATGSYLSTYQQTPETEALYLGAFLSPALSDAAHYYGYDGTGGTTTPISELTTLGSQNTARVTGGLAANWRPTAWFVGHATLGLDHGSQQSKELNYPLANAAYELFSPSLGLVSVTTDVYSVDLRGTATATLTRWIGAVTSWGLQMVDARTVGQSGFALGITPTNLTLNGAAGPTVTQQANRQATLGGYGEEELRLADRLFLTGALRVDAGSGFGRAYTTAAYPKASASWLAVDRGSTTIRLRGAFGEAGVQPMNGASQTLYAASVAYLGGGPVTTYPVIWPGNQHLRPERSEEFEGGIDVGAWGSRASFEFTWYSKTTRDALVNERLFGSVCCYTLQENIGKVLNTGVEGSARAALVQGRTLAWDVGINASVNRNKLVSLAPGVLAQKMYGYYNESRQAPGFPLYGFWGPQVTYADANHDGTVEGNEVTVADSETYVGPSLPTQEASIVTHLGFWRGAMTLGALVDYRGGYRISNTMAVIADQVGNQRQENDPTAPLWLQSRAVANTVQGAYPEPASYLEDGSFVRFREVAVTYAAPLSVARKLRVQSVSVTGAVRNLALWTRYTGPDPEVNNPDGNNILYTPSTGGYLVNNNVREDVGAVPLAQYWVLRVNLGL